MLNQLISFMKIHDLKGGQNNPVKVYVYKAIEYLAKQVNSSVYHNQAFTQTEITTITVQSKMNNNEQTQRMHSESTADSELGTGNK